MDDTNEDRAAAEVQADITCPDFEALAGHLCCERYLGDAVCAVLERPITSSDDIIRVVGHRSCPWPEQNDYLTLCDVYGEKEILALKRRKPLDLNSSPLDMFGNPNPDYQQAHRTARGRLLPKT